MTLYNLKNTTLLLLSFASLSLAVVMANTIFSLIAILFFTWVGIRKVYYRYGY